MKLYYSPGACSLASHIALHEAGMAFDCIAVDLQNRRTEDSSDYTAINPKGYVPALKLDDGQLLTENVALLDWIAQRSPKLVPSEEMGRTRLIEMLAFISTEIHKQFGRTAAPTSDAERDEAFSKIDQRYAYLAGELGGDYLFGDAFSAADAYLFVTLRWAEYKQRQLPEALQRYKTNVEARPAVRLALRHEGLDAQPA